MKQKSQGLCLLLLDVGNTSVTYGIWHGGRLGSVGCCPNSKIPRILSKFTLNASAIPNRHIVLSSVVPKMTKIIENLVRKNGRFNHLWVAGKNIHIPLRHRYFPINKLGSDRLVNAYGCLKLYGGPLLILDYGTALTCDFISKNGTFQGGLIIPGPEVALEALCKRAALLPTLAFPKQARRVRPLVGRNTVEGMEAGILQGYGAMTDSLVERFRNRYGRLRVVATGGLARVIGPYTSKLDIVDPFLTLRSLVKVFKGCVEIPQSKIPS